MLEQHPKLFSAFPPASQADWRRQLEKDLKGEKFEDLVWHNENGFDIEPIYSHEHVKHKYEPAFYHTDWNICIQSEGNEAEQLNRLFLTYLNRGATSVAMRTCNVDLRRALRNVGLEFIHATFFCRPECIPFLNEFLEENHDLPKLHISIFPEEIRTANEFAIWTRTIELFRDRGFAKTTAVNVLPFHEQNCSASLELALALSYLTEYLEKKSLGMKAVVVKMGADTDYFMQIAKFRALRRLWEILKKEYKAENPLHLIVETSRSNKSYADPQTNLLRTTLESMAAVAGGCNELVVNAYDVLHESRNETALRLSINQQLILKEEAHLNQMGDVSRGSFYIENLTDQLAISSLEKFRKIEKQGGYFAALENGHIAEELKKSREEKFNDLNSGKRFMVGVNKFQDVKGQKQINVVDLEKVALKEHIVARFELEQIKKTSNA